MNISITKLLLPLVLTALLAAGNSFIFDFLQIPYPDMGGVWFVIYFELAEAVSDEQVYGRIITRSLPFFAGSFIFVVVDCVCVSSFWRYPNGLSRFASFCGELPSVILSCSPFFVTCLEDGNLLRLGI